MWVSHRLDTLPNWVVKILRRDRGLWTDWCWDVDTFSLAQNSSVTANSGDTLNTGTRDTPDTRDMLDTRDTRDKRDTGLPPVVCCQSARITLSHLGVKCEVLPVWGTTSDWALNSLAKVTVLKVRQGSAQCWLRQWTVRGRIVSMTGVCWPLCLTHRN